MAISPLRPNMVFTNKQGVLTKEAADFLLGIFLRLGGSLANLNAASLENATWEAPNPIGATTPNSGKFTGIQTGTLAVTGTATHTGTTTLTGGVASDAAGFKHKRVAATVAASSNALVTVTWPTAFADTNYTVTCSVVDPTASTSSAAVVHIESISASSVTVRINNTSTSAYTGTVHIIAVHD
jgi:hypothetical protein